MDADGTHVEQLTQSPVSEFCPVVLDDGRVMYHRWEYIDKGARVAKTVWSMNPDGTRPQELYGLADDDTTIYMYPQPLPGSNHRFVCVGTCHFPQGGCLGAILLVDFGMGVRVRGPDPDEAGYVQGDDRYPVVNITPQVFIQRRTEPGWHFRTKEGKYVHDGEGRKGHLYTHPYPVSDRQFLVSYKVNPSDHYKEVANAYALVPDRYRGTPSSGSRRSPSSPAGIPCRWSPGRSRRRCNRSAIRNTPPATRPSASWPMSTRAWRGSSRGQVKWLRINEALPRYWSTGRRWEPSLSSSSWKAALWPRVQWGVVPVEKDGSAHFLVPANRSIFFQALDENFRELQRERTYVNYAPGEVRSCTGCHGQSNRTRVAGRLRHAAGADPGAEHAPAAAVRSGRATAETACAGQVIHYPTDIQPIFDAKCVSCHGADESRRRAEADR